MNPAWDARDRGIVLGVGVAVFAFIAVTTSFTPAATNNYVLLADAWLHGRSWIRFPGDWIDAVPYHGRAYVVEAPFPALLLVPLVAAFGTQANQNVLAAALASVAAAAMYRFARDAGDGRFDALVLCAFLLFGTDAMYAGMTGDVWLVAHVCALAFTLLALVELNGRRRPWAVLLCGLAAALSRYPFALALPVYGWLLRERIRRARPLLCALAATLPLLALWGAYNWSRWRMLYDPGFTIWYHVMDPRAKQNPSPLSLANLPQQIRLLLFEPPNVLNASPWIAPKRFGTALTFVGTGLVVAFAARLRERLAPPLVVLTVLLALPALLYYDIGGVQFGVRHALDFEPFVLALIALALRRPPRRWKRVLLLGSAAFGAYLLFVWRAFPGAVN